MISDQDTGVTEVVVPLATEVEASTTVSSWSLRCVLSITSSQRGGRPEDRPE
eukprot:COSAG01_NODE_50183_length_365_cov_1.161654_1_plen_51_part_01